MGRKRAYRETKVKDLSLDAILEKSPEGHATVGVGGGPLHSKTIENLVRSA
jgi:hypothetical protein